MTRRKQTPDILDEILGGETSIPQPRATPAPKTSPRTKRTAPKSSRPPTPPQQQWEYMEVVFHDYDGYRPRYVNGVEQTGWKQLPVIHEYLNQRGAEGWELVGLGSRHKRDMSAYFKRPKG
jgi:hypothetical protein